MQVMAEQLTLGVPGIVLFLEIHGALGLRGGGFLLGCQLAAIFGLFAHPGGHLICQTGEHSAMCVNGLASESALPSPFRSNDVSRLRTRRNRARSSPKPSRDRSDDGYDVISSVLATARLRTA